MLSPELEKRITNIISKLETKCSDKCNKVIENEKYEYHLQKNAKKRLSQMNAQIPCFVIPQEEEKNNDVIEKKNKFFQRPSIALNVNKLITVGEFQIEFGILLNILETVLNNDDNDNNNDIIMNCLKKYADNIISDTDSNINNRTDCDDKIEKFLLTLKKKYHKILLLLQRYIKENKIVDDLIEKEKAKLKNTNNLNNKNSKNVPRKSRRRSLFERFPNRNDDLICPFLINNDNNNIIKADNCEKEEPVQIREFPKFGNTLLSEIKEGIRKRKSCVDIGNKENKYKFVFNDVNNDKDKENVIEEKSESESDSDSENNSKNSDDKLNENSASTSNATSEIVVKLNQSRNNLLIKIVMMIILFFSFFGVLYSLIN